MQAFPCDTAADHREVAAAFADIERSVDPCGGSAELLDVLRRFRICAQRGFEICSDPHSERNFIERIGGADGTRSTITWNPQLRSELERGCDGDPNLAVRRDPTASLLHELVHAVQDCRGLDPADHEFEAVRIENVYRRARRLCQRTRYGEQPLPVAMRIACEPGDCRCEMPGRTLVSAPPAVEPAALREHSAGDTAGR